MGVRGGRLGAIGSSDDFFRHPHLDSLQATLEKLNSDEERHRDVLQRMRQNVHLPHLQSQHCKMPFSESGYVFVRSLGMGRCGQVKLAKKKRTGAPGAGVTRAMPRLQRSTTDLSSPFVAVRIIPRYRMQNGGLVNDENFSQQEKKTVLMMQIDALRMLDHPNVCREFETFEDENNIYIIMELYTGGDLLSRENGPLPEARVAWIMDQLLGAMSHAHERGIVHQDLRPENVLYATADEDSRVVITDWSMAEFLHTRPEDSRRNLIFTEYSAPELEPSQRTDRGDVWSLGAMAFALLTLTHAFSGPVTDDFHWASRGENISTVCCDFVSQLMRLDLRTRPSAREAMQHPFLRQARAAASRQAVLISDSTAASIVRFRGQSLLHKAAATFAAVHLSGSKLHELTSFFQSADENGDGTVSREELQEALQKQVEATKIRLTEDDSQEDAVGEEEVQGTVSDASQMAAVVAAMDVDGSGRVQYSEFLAAATAALMQDSVHLCWEAFRTFDLDGNGYVSKTEIEKVLYTAESLEIIDRLRTPGAVTKAEMEALAEIDGGPPEDPKDVLAKLDKNGDSVVSFAEFVEALYGTTVKEGYAGHSRRPSISGT